MARLSDGQQIEYKAGFGGGQTDVSDKVFLQRQIHEIAIIRTDYRPEFRRILTIVGGQARF